MLLDHGELGLNSARLADIGGFRQPILGPDQVGPEPQAFPAGRAISAGAFGLQPVQQREAELLGPGDVRLGLLP